MKISMLKKTRILLCLICLFCPGYAAVACALEILPYRTHNQSPLVQNYGLPIITDAKTMHAGENMAVLTVDIANQFVARQRTRESIVIDGESYRYNIVLRHGVTPDFEIGLVLPYVMHRKGFLDSFIEGWHDTFDMPQNERDKTPRDRLLYSYSRNGEEQFRLDSPSEGIGDIRLTSAWQLYSEEGPSEKAVALHATLKLPTGNSNRFLGSGSTDLALSLGGSRRYPLDGSHTKIFGSAGILFMTDGDVLDQQRNMVGFGSLGAGWAPWHYLALKMQIDGHTSFYGNSELKELNSASLQLTLGGALAISDSTSLGIGITEDLVVNTASDVVFHLELRKMF